MAIRFELPPRGALQRNGEHDPLPYYYHRWVGWLYRHRLQMGLDLLRPGRHVLEVGVGSGILIPTLTRHYAEYTGSDLVLAPGLGRLVASGCRATFRTADLLRDDDLPAAHYDAVVCFSVLEHIADAHGAARALARVLAPRGTLVAGYPMINRWMTRAFALIGYRGIDHIHVTPPATIASALAQVLEPVARVAFPPAAPAPIALYQCTAWTSRA
jgi:SAM-dependent methyltransferase